MKRRVHSNSVRNIRLGKGPQERRSMAKVLTVPDAEKARLTYDEEGDVLYMSFGESREAIDSIGLDGIAYRYHGGNLIGITVLGFKKRAEVKQWLS